MIRICAYSSPSGTGYGLVSTSRHLLYWQNWPSSHVTPAQSTSRNPEMDGKYSGAAAFKRGRSATDTSNAIIAYQVIVLIENFFISKLWHLFKNTGPAIQKVITRPAPFQIYQPFLF